MKWKDLPFVEACWVPKEKFDAIPHSELAIAEWKRFQGHSKKKKAHRREIVSHFKTYQNVLPKLKNTDLELKPHQVEGFQFIMEGYFNNNNLILADEMGLGNSFALYLV